MSRQTAVAEIRLGNITTCLKLAVPLLNELNDAFGPPFVQTIAKTIQAIINLIELMNSIHQVLCAIINLHIKSETVGALPPSMLRHIGKFIETLHKTYAFVEAQQEGNKIKQLFRNHEINTLLRDCRAGLREAMEVFEISTMTENLNDIKHFENRAHTMHQELLELIQTLSDTSTLSERSLVYTAANQSKNSSNSFSLLPPKPKIFHGREEELNTILKLLGQNSPKIAILGGGGMGKTSLARAVLHHPDTSSKFENRFFVSAEAASTSIELAALIGLHVGLNPGQDLTKPVIEYFAEKPHCLLILDNLETVWEPTQFRAGVEEFLSLLTDVEHLALVITMRGAERPAKVQWTHPFLLPLRPLSDDAARQTFMDITDNSNTMEELDQLLRFTDNMPLAVDLIANLVDYEGFFNVLERWETEKTSLLSTGFDRHSSLEASLWLSLSSPRITSDSKELLSILSILPNGLSREELVQVSLGIPNILSCKAALQATSLAYQDSDQRLMLLMPIREYIQQIMPPAQSHIQLVRDHFYSLLELFMKYGGEQLKPVVSEITFNLGNLQEILHRGLHPQSPTLANTIHCALSLNSFYVVTGRDHCLLLDNIWPLVSGLGDHRLEIMFLIEMIINVHYCPVVSDEMIAQATMHLDHINDPLLCSKFYYALGVRRLYHKNDVEQGTQYLDKALEMSQLSGDINWQCKALVQLGWFKCRTGNYSAADKYATSAQRLAESAANLYQQITAVQLGAICSKSLGNYHRSVTQLFRASELVHICGMSQGWLAYIITVDQAELHLLKSEYTDARTLFCQILETGSNADSSLRASALWNIGLIEIMIGGREEEICHSLKGAQEIFSKFEDRRSILCLQAVIELRERKADSAKIKFQECLYWPGAKNPDIECLCLEQLMEINSLPASKQHLEWPIIYILYASKAQHKWALHRAFLFLGDVFIANNDEDTATNLYHVSLAGFTEMDVHHSRAQCMLRLGDLAKKDGRTYEAITFWKAAQPLFAQSLQIKDVAQIDLRLATLENADQQRLLKLETLHAPTSDHLVTEENSEIGGKDSVHKEAEEHTIPITV
ncbi:hypothetical protein K438DRAFT_2092589 [Mycena galopus ATCC 62051]|nr:hypothetical protein K438DRAFT_2092589 [Mycena galopus ATCC 62051]